MLEDVIIVKCAHVQWRHRWQTDDALTNRLVEGMSLQSPQHLFVNKQKEISRQRAQKLTRVSLGQRIGTVRSFSASQWASRYIVMRIEDGVTVSPRHRQVSLTLMTLRKEFRILFCPKYRIVWAVFFGWILILWLFLIFPQRVGLSKARCVIINSQFTSSKNVQSIIRYILLAVHPS